MRYFCWSCKQSVTSELPDDSIIRAVLVCPECIEKGRVKFPEKEHQWEFYMNGSFCKICGAQIGSGTPCR